MNMRDKILSGLSGHETIVRKNKDMLAGLREQQTDLTENRNKDVLAITQTSVLQTELHHLRSDLGMNTHNIGSKSNFFQSLRQDLWENEKKHVWELCA